MKIKVLLYCIFFFLIINSSICFAENNINTKNLDVYAELKHNKIYSVLTFRNFDNFLPNANLSYYKQKLFKINENQYLIIGGQKLYSSSKKTKIGTLLKNEGHIFKLDLEKKSLLPVCTINDELIIGIHPIKENKIILVGKHSISEFDIKTSICTELISFDFNLFEETDSSYLINDKIILVNSSRGKIYSVDINNKVITLISDYLEQENIFCIGNILLENNKILFFNGFDFYEFFKESNYNYIYSLSENKFLKDSSLGKLNKIHKVSDSEYLLITYSKQENYDISGENLYKYDNIRLFNLKKKHIVKKLKSMENYFESPKARIAKFNLKKMGEKILFFENNQTVNQYYDINTKNIEKYKNKEFKDIGEIQEILSIKQNIFLIISDIGVFIYKT